VLHLNLKKELAVTPEQKRAKQLILMHHTNPKPILASTKTFILWEIMLFHLLILTKRETCLNANPNIGMHLEPKIGKMV
jgi:hypothetical protein